MVTADTETGWEQLGSEQLPEIIGAFVVGILILGIPTLCWQTIKWNRTRGPNARFRRILFWLPSFTGIAWLASTVVIVIALAENHYNLDLGVKPKIDRFLNELPGLMDVNPDWLPSQLQTVHWFALILSAVVLLVAVRLIESAFNQTSGVHHANRPRRYSLLFLLRLSLQKENRQYRSHIRKYSQSLCSANAFRQWVNRFAPLQLSNGREPYIGVEVENVDSDHSQRIDLVALLKRKLEGGTCSRLLILGEPGCGKTTAIQKTVLDLAKQTSRIFVFRPSPICIPSLAADFEKSDTLRSLALKGIRRWYPDFEERFLDRLLRDSDTIIFIDALDEIELERREGLAKLLAAETFGGKSENVRFVVSCRTRQDPQDSLPTFEAYRIQPLSDSSIADLIRVYSESKIPPIIAQQRLRQLGLLAPTSLLRNPFWLHHAIATGTWSQSSSAILRSSIRKTLVREFSKSTRHSRTWIKGTFENVSQFCEEVEGHLEWIALQFDFAPYVERDNLHHKLRSRFKGRTSRLGTPSINPMDFLEFAVEAGLLRISSDKLTFSHRLFQEFLTATALSADQAPPKRLNEFVANPERWQTLSFILSNHNPDSANAIIEKILDFEKDATLALACAIAVTLTDNSKNYTKIIEKLHLRLVRAIEGEDPSNTQLNYSIAQLLRIGFDASAAFLSEMLSNRSQRVRTRVAELLSLSGSPTAARSLVYFGLTDSVQEVRVAAHNSLTVIGDVATWPLIRQLLIGSESSRFESALILGKIGAPQAFNFLIDADVEESTAVAALSGCVTRRIGRAITVLSKGTKAQKLRVVRALASIDEPRARRAVEMARKDFDKDISKAAGSQTKSEESEEVLLSSKLRQIRYGSDLDVELIVRCCKNESPDLRSLAIEAIYGHNRPGLSRIQRKHQYQGMLRKRHTSVSAELVKQVYGHVNDPSDDVRRTLARFLSNQIMFLEDAFEDTTDATNQLERLIADASPRVRLAAIEALQDLKGIFNFGMSKESILLVVDSDKAVRDAAMKVVNSSHSSVTRQSIALLKADDAFQLQIRERLKDTVGLLDSIALIHMLGDKVSMDCLKAYLKSSDLAVLSATCIALANHSWSDVENALQPLTKSTIIAERIASVEILRTLSNSGKDRLVYSMLGDSSPEVRIALAAAINTLDGPMALRTLIDHASTDPDDAVRSAYRDRIEWRSPLNEEIDILLEALTKAKEMPILECCAKSLWFVYRASEEQKFKMQTVITKLPHSLQIRFKGTSWVDQEYFLRLHNALFKEAVEAETFAERNSILDSLVALDGSHKEWHESQSIKAGLLQSITNLRTSNQSDLLLEILGRCFGSSDLECIKQLIVLHKVQFNQIKSFQVANLEDSEQVVSPRIPPNHAFEIKALNLLRSAQGESLDYINSVFESSSVWFKRVAAVVCLSQQNQVAFDDSFFNRLFCDQDWRVRCCAVALSSTSEPLSLVNTLIRMTGDETEVESELNSLVFINSLVTRSLVASMPKRPVTFFAAHRLASIPSTVVVEDAFARNAPGDLAFRTGRVQVASAIRSQRGTSRLIEALQDTDASIRRYAVIGLIDRTVEVAVEVIAEMLNDQDARVTMPVAEALCTNRYENGIEHVYRWCESFVKMPIDDVCKGSLGVLRGVIKATDFSHSAFQAVALKMLDCCLLCPSAISDEMSELFELLPSHAIASVLRIERNYDSIKRVPKGVIKAIAKSGEPAGTRLILIYLSDSRQEDILDLACGIASIGDPLLIAPLLERIKSVGLNDTSRLQVGKLLAAIGPDGWVELRKHFEHEETTNEIWGLIAHSLSQSGDLSIASTLLHSLANRENTAKLSAAQALDALGDPVIVELMKPEYERQPIAGEYSSHLRQLLEGRVSEKESKVKGIAFLDTANSSVTTDDKFEASSMPLSGHVRELRNRLGIVSLIAALCYGVSAIFAQGSNFDIYRKVFSVLKNDFDVQLLLSGWLASPFIFHQLLVFVVPGLYPSERRMLYFAIPFFATALFAWPFATPIIASCVESVGFSPAIAMSIGNFAYWMLQASILWCIGLRPVRKQIDDWQRAMMVKRLADGAAPSSEALFANNPLAFARGAVIWFSFCMVLIGPLVFEILLLGAMLGLLALTMLLLAVFNTMDLSQQASSLLERSMKSNLWVQAVRERPRLTTFASGIITGVQILKLSASLLICTLILFVVGSLIGNPIHYASSSAFSMVAAIAVAVCCLTSLRVKLPNNKYSAYFIAGRIVLFLTSILGVALALVETCRFEGGVILLLVGRFGVLIAFFILVGPIFSVFYFRANFRQTLFLVLVAEVVAAIPLPLLFSMIVSIPAIFAAVLGYPVVFAMIARGPMYSREMIKRYL